MTPAEIARSLPVEDIMMMIELAERCEAAAGPNRELDAAIVCALYPDAQVARYCSDDDEPVVFHAEPLVRNKHWLPAFTASLDAAMTLVPQGWAYRIDGWQSYSASVFLPEKKFCRAHVKTGAALALCAAALRARASAAS